MRKATSVGIKPPKNRVRTPAAGFSIVELVVALAIAFILLAVSIPGFLKSWNMYRLASEASQIASQLDILRFTAVRRNATTFLYLSTSGPNTVLFVDTNKNHALDSGEPELLLSTDMQIMQSGFPSTSSMGSAYSTTLPLASGTGLSSGISLGARGTVVYPVGSTPAPYVIVIGYPNSPQYGYRAITITAMGEIRVWTASSGGAWSPAS
jgi:Tfp pilus assembly protein FimT